VAISLRRASSNGQSHSGKFQDPASEVKTIPGEIWFVKGQVGVSPLTLTATTDWVALVLQAPNEIGFYIQRCSLLFFTFK
jgi:hypothetical protein